MLALRASKVIALWSVVAVAVAHAFIRSAAASTLDGRVPWGLPVIALPLGLGMVLASVWARRQPSRFRALDADAVGLVILVGALLVSGLSHVPGQTSIRVLLEEIPPLFLPLYPLMALFTPLALARTRARCDVADQALVIALAASTLSGGLVLLSGGQALGLALVVLLMQLSAGDGRIPWRAPVVLLVVLAALLVLATQFGSNTLTAMPSLRWSLAFLALGLAVAARPRDAAGWQLVLGVPVAVATLVACCGIVLTAFLALEVDLEPALDTRLTLFRQHPNFLGPFFAFHALLALGLGLASRRLRVPAFLAMLLLALSTVHTDSRAGNGCLALGLVALPCAAWLARRVAARRFTLPSLPRVMAALCLLAALGLAGWFLAGDRIAAWTSVRFERSFEYRIDAWRNSLAVVAGHPWLGIGPHTFESVERFAPGSRFFNEPESPHPHNVLLYVAQAAGVPALLVFVAWIVLLVLGLLRETSRGRPLHTGLGAATLAAVVGLLAANMLDLGMALDTVLPVPLFLIAGLLAARAADDGRITRLRTGPGLLIATALLALLWRQALDPVRAETSFEQAQLLAFLAPHQGRAVEDMQDAREHMAHSLRLDPDNGRAYEILARWEEATDGGFTRAHDILSQRLGRAPHYGPTHALLGRLFLRAGLFDEAYTAFATSLADSHGSRFLNQDRADAILCLTRLGRRDEALDLLAEALRLDVEIIHTLAWANDPVSGQKQLPVAQGQGAPVRLVDAVELAVARQVADREAGRPVGRSDWMSTYLAFRKAERDDRALQLLADYEAHVPVVEKHTLATERAWIAEDAGDLAGALQLWEQAYGLSRNPYYETHIARLRALLGEEIASRDQGALALSASGEILAQPTAFRDNLDARADASAAEHPGEAAALLTRTLLYEDDLLARARRWRRVADLWRRAQQWERALSADAEALATLTARPFPAAMLQDGFTDSLPGHIARSMIASWRALGLDAHGVQQRAWALDDFFSSRAAPSLFRLELFAENGQMDHLLKEAELQRLIDPENLLAMWAELLALEGLGRIEELRSAMRTLCEFVNSQHSLERLANGLIASIQSSGRMSDPGAWREIALITLLRGRYGEAADLFARARDLSTDAAESARIAGWQARALLLTDRPDRRVQAAALLEDAARALPHDGALRARREALR